MNETEARDFIAKEVSRLVWTRLAGLAALLGVANIVALIGLWYSVSSQAEKTAQERATAVAEREALRAVDGDKKKIEGITSAAQTQVESLQKSTIKLHTSIGSIENDLARLSTSSKKLEDDLARLEKSTKQATEGAPQQFAKAAAEFAALPDGVRASIKETVNLASKRLQSVEDSLANLKSDLTLYAKTDALQAVDKRIVHLDGRSEIREDGTGYLKIGDMQICWGRNLLKLPANPDHRNAREFNFKFAKQFDGDPTVSTAVLTNGSPHSFDIYSWKTTSDAFLGSVINHPGNATTDVDVTMEYLAVGRAKK